MSFSIVTIGVSCELLRSSNTKEKVHGRWHDTSPCDNERTIALWANALRYYEAKSSELIPPASRSRESVQIPYTVDCGRRQPYVAPHVQVWGLPQRGGYRPRSIRPSSRSVNVHVGPRYRTNELDSATNHITQKYATIDYRPSIPQSRGYMLYLNPQIQK